MTSVGERQNSYAIVAASGDAYDAALTIFERAVAAFCTGAVNEGDSLLATLDTAAIERDRQAQLQLARTARPAPKYPIISGGYKKPTREVQEAVQRRDRYHCRYTGRRLIEKRVCHEVSRLSLVFHFDRHYALRPTSRGPAGHVMTRTHIAAYEHGHPFSCGGLTVIENMFHTSVQLNESKGAKLLSLVDVPLRTWNGLREYLDALQRQPTKPNHKPIVSVPSPAYTRKKPMTESAPNPQLNLLARIRAAAEGLPVTIYSESEEQSAEKDFLRVRRAERNAYFATPREAAEWMIHRLYCSSLSFTDGRKLTANAKICAAQEATLQEWGARFGAEMTRCKRCRKAQR